MSGSIKSIERRGDRIELWVDTRGALAWHLEATTTLESPRWSPREVLDGGQPWQQVVILHTEEMQFLRLLPVIDPE